MAYKDLAVIIIPTLNEKEGVGRTVGDVVRFVPGCRVLIIDSFSEDGTADIARDHGATVIDAPRGGKGLAVRSALPGIISTYLSKWYIMLDGDYTYPAKHIPAMLQELENGADVVMGYRASKEGDSMSRMNRIGNWGLSALASTLCMTRIRDVCTGMWGFSRRALCVFNLTSVGFTLEADFLMNTVRYHLKLAQIPIEYRSRADGSTTKLGIRDGFKIASFMIKNRPTGGY